VAPPGWNPSCHGERQQPRAQFAPVRTFVVFVPFVVHFVSDD
jgi:hypothetical protein